MGSRPMGLTPIRRLAASRVSTAFVVRWGRKSVLCVSQHARRLRWWVIDVDSTIDCRAGARDPGGVTEASPQGRLDRPCAYAMGGRGASGSSQTEGAELPGYVLGADLPYEGGPEQRPATGLHAAGRPCRSITPTGSRRRLRPSPGSGECALSGNASGLEGVVSGVQGVRAAGSDALRWPYTRYDQNRHSMQWVLRNAPKWRARECSMSLIVATGGKAGPLTPHPFSFEKMIVPDAANMPPTPWQTEILAPLTWAAAVPRIWRTLSCSAYMPYMPECM